jgi:Luciferase-like monooxygenase
MSARCSWNEANRGGHRPPYRKLMFLEGVCFGTWLLTVERRTFGFGPRTIRSTARTGRIHLRNGDGLITAGDEEPVIKAFNAAGGKKKTTYAQLTVCWARTEKEARRIAREWWPTGVLPWSLLSELALPKYFEEAAESATEDAIAEAIVCGPDPENHIAKIRKMTKAGADHVFVHQVGKDQEGFFRFYEHEVLPEFGVESRRAA